VQVRLLARIGAAAALVALLAAGESSAYDASQPACRLSQLALSVGQEVSAATGHNPFSVHLKNRGSQSCVLKRLSGDLIQ